MANFQELETRVERLEREVMMLKMRLKTTLPLEPPTPEELARRKQVAARILAFAESKRGTGITLSDIVMEWRERWRE
ncbi:MAG: hypothetical protein ACK40X_03590 [Armatimonadota bacterium]